MWQEAIIVLDLSLKSDVTDKLQKGFYFMWTYLSLRFCKQLKMKSPAHSKKGWKKRPSLKEGKKKIEDMLVLMKSEHPLRWRIW